MTALSIKESVVTAVQRVLRMQGEKTHSQLHYNWEILGHINILINMRESITEEAQGLSRIWLLGSCLVHQMSEINTKLNITQKIHNRLLLPSLSPLLILSWTRFTHSSSSFHTARIDLKASCKKDRNRTDCKGQTLSLEPGRLHLHGSKSTFPEINILSGEKV